MCIRLYLRGALKAGLLLLPLLVGIVSCKDEILPDRYGECSVSLEELADILSRLPIGQEQMDEVFAAVSSSSGNGYDEEYMMADLFDSPGSGVGEAPATKAGEPRWERPMRALIEEYLSHRYETRAGEDYSTEEYIAALMDSDAQIYWPYSESWDGVTLPVITFDPQTTAYANIGYELCADGSVVETVVTEEVARERPVWVVNRNDDSAFPTIETLRRDDPDWGRGGGIRVKSEDVEEPESQTLYLKSFQANRNFDPWFAGASEFFVKCGSIEDFTASTEAEMRLYSPSVTDFMIVVKRDMIGQRLSYEAVMVSDWTDQLSSLAFLITEDDGGTRTSWKCSATVRIKSKSYGFDIEIPFNSYDDIVWRGQLSRKYFTKKNNVEGHFGDVYITFQIE